jgi:hypothetical protein
MQALEEKDMPLTAMTELQEPPSEISSPISDEKSSLTWSTRRKVYHTAVPCLFAFLM